MTEGRIRRGKDLVKQDGKIKEVVFMEELTHNNWKNRWGFIQDCMKTYQEKANEYDLPSQETFKTKRNMISTSNEINTTVPISPTVPKTSSGFVGWRSSQPQYTLERVGPLYTSPAKTIEPPQLIQTIPQQHVIFIG